MINSISRFVPMFFLADRQKTGKIDGCERQWIAPYSFHLPKGTLLKDFFHQRLVVFSCRFYEGIVKSVAFSISTAGIGNSSRMPVSSLKLYIFIVITSMKLSTYTPVI